MHTNDSHGRVYIILAFSELEKKHQGFDKHDGPEEPRMYAQAGDNCPVRTFDLYIFKLHPLCDAFFQRPISNFKVITGGGL